MRLSSSRLAVLGALAGAALFALPAAADSAKTPRCLGAPATIVGTAGDDVIAGTKHRDVILALGGDDVISTAGGNDRICGGDGSDTLSFAGSEAPVVASLADGTATAEGVAQFESIESIVGSPQSDTLAGDEGANVLEGLGGDDTLSGGGGRDTVSFASFPGRPGTSGPIGIGVSLAAGTAFGAGSDTLTGFEDVLGSEFRDVIAGDGAPNLLRGLGDDDSLQGLAGADAIDGGSGLDGIDGGAGDDTIDGGPGGDMISFGGATGGATADLAAGTATAPGLGTDALTSVERAAGTPFGDDLFGDEGENLFLGNDGADLLQSFDGDDWLEGGDGDDILRGGAGTDRLDGGPQTDECVEGETLLGCERTAIGMLRTATGGLAESTDPGVAFDTFSWHLLAPSCMRLQAYADTNPAVPALVPDAAVGPPLVSPGGLNYTYTIRPGLHFSSGEPLTAASFVRAFERVRDPALGSPGGAYIHDIVSFAAFGDRLVVTLARPAGDLPARLSMPFFCAVPLGTPTVAQSQPLAAGGPYVLSHPEATLFVLERNPAYRGRRSSVFDRIEVRGLVDNVSALAGVEAGGIDLLDDLPPTAVPRLRADYGPDSPAAAAGRQRYFVAPLGGMFYTALNTERAFGDRRLRRAVAYAVDRTALAGVSGVDGMTPNDQLLTSLHSGFQEVEIFPLTADLDTARALAATAGVTPQTPRAVTLYVTNGANAVARGDLLRQQLSSLGLDVTVIVYPFAEFVRRVGTRGEPFDLAMIGWLPDYLDGWDTLNVLLDGSRLQPANNSNYSYFDDPVFNERLHAASELTGPERDAAYGQLDHDLTAEAALVPYGHSNNRVFFSDRIGCHAFDALSRNPSLNALCVRQ